MELESRAQQLFDEGASKLGDGWDDAVSMCRYASHPEVHSPRETLAYAQILLRAGRSGAGGAGDPGGAGAAGAA